MTNTLEFREWDGMSSLSDQIESNINKFYSHPQEVPGSSVSTPIVLDDLPVTPGGKRSRVEAISPSPDPAVVLNPGGKRSRTSVSSTSVRRQ